MNKTYIVIGSALLLLIVAFNSIFIVSQTQFGVIFQFGEAIRVIDQAGLQTKVPFIQNVEYFEKRILSVEAEAKELTASDGKRLIVDAFTRFRITDPILFYKTVYNYHGVKIRLTKILESSLRKVIGRVPLITLLSAKRNEVMTEIAGLVNKEAKSFGVDVIDVRISKADLPKENSAAIYKRMQTARATEAMKIRAEGQEEGVRIRSESDKQSKIILAEAYKNSQIIRGEGDAAAAQIYNQIYSKDPEFYKFYQNLVACRNSFKNNNNSFILNPESSFLKILNLSK